MMQSTFERAATDISCGECRTMLKTRIQEAMEEWSAVPVRHQFVTGRNSQSDLPAADDLSAASR